MYADSLKRILKRTDERRGCIVGWLTFWNPKNLQKKVDMYGYHFSWKTHAVMIFLALAGVIGIGAVFRLKAGGVVIALTAVIMMLPVLVLDMHKRPRRGQPHGTDCRSGRAARADAQRVLRGVHPRERQLKYFLIKRAGTTVFLLFAQYA